MDWGAAYRMLGKLLTLRRPKEKPSDRAASEDSHRRNKKPAEEVPRPAEKIIF